MKGLAQDLRIWLGVLLSVACVLRMPAVGQVVELPGQKTGYVVGTVIDVNGDAVSDADVLLEAPKAGDHRTVTTNENGYFEFNDVKPGIFYYVRISATGFADWTSEAVVLEPSQFKILTDIRLNLQKARTTVKVTETSEEIATEQAKVEEKQRVFGFLPNFYVSYEPNPEPLTTKLKFQLAFKLVRDPITNVFIGILSGAQQAGDTPDYGQGAQGFGKRFGANSADSLTSTMIGAAILPSVLHQDPRYFYQGTGSTRSRLRYAFEHPFVCKGDNGKMQPNYSSVGGDLISAGISNAYYPRSDRGAGLLLTNVAIGTGLHLANSLAQEFILKKFTHSPK
ncbi:MAG TPA: carboxypeptidase-like regulatory domain-containing protein [Terriglobales bacterium]|nr:carboxypeptidase-like regulatory domain-containing protein [Terriglobales bacterium]